MIFRMNTFQSDSCVFSDPEVAEHFLNCVNKNSDNEDVMKASDVWKWLRTPPSETVIR